ncbi:MAG: exo-alpha-sialidase [Chloroflexi bacterium]|nr:exo-alpha-sialidase [Chloroflexota bacterium]
MVERRYAPGTILLMVGTRKGLFIFSSNKARRRWQVEGPFIEGHRVFYATLDTRREMPRLFATDNGGFFGTYLLYSDDFGRTWNPPKVGVQFSTETGLKLENIWVIEPGRATEPETVYCGVDPAALFVSQEGGETWQFVNGLNNHPTRPRWEPGAGGLCLHSIIPHPSDKSQMWVGISAVGVMRTNDGGASWQMKNKNTRADFLPEKYPEFGQCVHHLIIHPQDPNILYQQNHCGIYKSTNGAEEWIDIQNGLPSDFGFPIALDFNHPNVVFAIVEAPPPLRHNLGDQFTVYRSEDGGKSWERLTRGLPQGPTVKLGVLRHALCTDALDPCGVYVGTKTGQLFASHDQGDSWKLIAAYLPGIYSVTCAVL